MIDGAHATVDTFSEEMWRICYVDAARCLVNSEYQVCKYPSALRESRSGDRSWPDVGIPQHLKNVLC